MAIEGVPWMVAGGLHSAEVGRQLAYAATNGATGIVLPTDLKVTALPTAGAAVRIGAGGASVVSNFPGAAGQSYVIRGVGATDIPVAKAGTSTTTRYVIIRITDPAYAGQPTPANPVVGPYAIPDVVSSITNLAYPFVPLAKIVMPANAVSVTNAMITDLRELANPREKQVMFPRPTLTTDDPVGLLLTATGADGEWFPNAGGEQYIEIPKWATRMQIEATWIGVLYGPEGSTGWGDYWVDFGATVSAQKLAYSTHKFRWDMPVGDYSRGNWELAHDVYVPGPLRGATIPFIMKARKEGGAVPKMDHRSGVILKVRFLEVPDLSDS